MKKIIVVILIFFTQIIAFSQTKISVSGFVYDSTSKEPLIGVMIQSKELNRVAFSNNSGYFNIPDLQCKTKLKFYLTGYESKTIDINENKILQIYLKEKPFVGKEVVSSAEHLDKKEKMLTKNISSIEINAIQLKNMPQLVENDLLRSLQNLPGVSTISDFSSELFVRGGQSDQNLFLIDGTEIYNPTHLFGLLSTFNTESIKKVNFLKGGFPAEYGGRLSSIIDVINIDGNKDKFICNVNLNLLTLKANAQIPLKKYGSISGSFRRTYFDQFLSKNGSSHYFFYDGNLKATIDVSEKNKITFSLFKSKDNLYNPLDYALNNNLEYNWNNITTSSNWQSIVNDNMLSNIWITYSRYSSYYKFNEEGVFESNEISDLSFKLKEEFFYRNDLKFKTGAEVKFLNLKLFQIFPDTHFNNNTNAKLFSFYFSSNWKPDILWDFELGLRTNLFSSDKNFLHLEPRFSIKYLLSENSNIKYAFGLYNQYVHRIHRGFIMGLYTLANKEIESSNAIHNILGYYLCLSDNFSLETEIYYKKFNNIYSLNQLFMIDADKSFFDIVNNGSKYNPYGIDFLKGKGYSYGLEFLFRVNIGKFIGYLSYTFSNTKYLIPNLNQGEYFYPRHHRSHSVNAALNFDVLEIIRKRESEKDSRILIGTNFSYNSGQPFTLPSSGFKTLNPVFKVNDSLFVYPTKINNGRLPDYLRLDLSIRYEIFYEKWKMIPYLQIFNIGNRKNVWAVKYNTIKEIDETKIGAESIGMIPIIPSIGVTIEF